MSTMKNLGKQFAGSVFRPLSWHDISKPGCPIIGYGIEEKPKGKRRYIARGFDMQIHPFKTKEEAQAKCDELNALAKGYQ